MTRTEIILALKDRIAKATPDLSRALDWMESTDPTLDIDDASLAEHHALCMLSEQTDEEPTLTDLECARAEGALMTEEMWAAQEDRDCPYIDRMMDLIRGGQ